LAAFGVITYPIALVVSGLYFSVAFIIAFALWFGGWGVIAAYVGCFNQLTEKSRKKTKSFLKREINKWYLE